MTELAGSFGLVAEEYELGRPGYAEAALDAVELPRDAVVLDLAAGTGKLTRQLVPRFTRVARGRAAGGDAGRARARRAGGGGARRDADAIPLGDGAVDAVFVGEAFHWFSTAATLGGDRTRAPAAAGRWRSSSTRPTATSSRRCRRRSGTPTARPRFRSRRSRPSAPGSGKRPSPGPFEPLAESSSRTRSSSTGRRSSRRRRRGA